MKEEPAEAGSESALAGLASVARVFRPVWMAGCRSQCSLDLLNCASLRPVPNGLLRSGECAMDLDQLLTIMTKQGASDLHIKPTRPPLLRLNGRLLPLKTDPLKIDEINGMVEKILTPAQKRKLEDRMSVDLGYGVPWVARFRGDIFVQRGNLAACFRRIPFEIMNVEDLDLPPVLSSSPSCRWGWCW